MQRPPSTLLGVEGAQRHPVSTIAMVERVGRAGRLEGAVVEAVERELLDGRRVRSGSRPIWRKKTR